MMTKSNNPADAIGLRVMLVAVPATYQGKPCMAIRIQPPPSATAAPPKPAARPARQNPDPPSAAARPARNPPPKKWTTTFHY